MTGAHVEVIEVIDRFYRNLIRRISRIPGHRLVILTSRDKRPLSKPPRDLEEYVYSRQSQLVRFAQSQLKGRVLILPAPPWYLHSIGSEIKQRFSTSIPVKVFGEYYGDCVRKACNSLRAAGFTVESQKSKSVD